MYVRAAVCCSKFGMDRARLPQAGRPIRTGFPDHDAHEIDAILVTELSWPAWPSSSAI